MVYADVQQLLNSAIAALRAGDRNECRRLLFLATNADPRNETAWLMLSDLMETRYERIDCLEKVLNINPDNIEARAALEELEAGVIATDQQKILSPVLQAEEQTVDLRQELLGDAGQQPGERQRRAGGEAQKPGKRGGKRGKMSSGQVVILAILGLAALGCLVAAGVFVIPNALRYASWLAKSTQQAAVTQPSATPRATQTTAPTQPAIATQTPRPTATARLMPSATKSATSSATKAETRAAGSPTPTTTLAAGATRTLEFTQKTGPILAAGQRAYNLQISITGVRFTMGGVREPRTGDYRYIVIDLKITNLGPGVAQGIGNFGFYLRDSQDTLHSPTMQAYLAQKCFLGTADIEVRESHTGCLAFEARMIGGMALIYQPLWKEPDFVITFPLR